MPRKTPPLALVEMPGELHPDLATVQRSARPQMANDLAVTIRNLLSSGVLVVRDGRIIPRE